MPSEPPRNLSDANVAELASIATGLKVNVAISNHDSPAELETRLSIQRTENESRIRREVVAFYFGLSMLGVGFAASFICILLGGPATQAIGEKLLLFIVGAGAGYVTGSKSSAAAK